MLFRSLSNSSDPNAKVGPAGYGPEGFIKPDTIIPYRIDFENESSATAPAQQVLISDTLDANLDWNTLELTEFGFGDHIISIPTKTQHYETTISMNYNDQDFDVLVEIGFKSSTGEVYAKFNSIDRSEERRVGKECRSRWSP